MPAVGHGGRAMHERSHSDTPTLPLPVHLSAESSSVTSLSNLPLRKTVTSGMFQVAFPFPIVRIVPGLQLAFSLRIQSPYLLL